VRQPVSENRFSTMLFLFVKVVLFLRKDLLGLIQIKDFSAKKKCTSPVQ